MARVTTLDTLELADIFDAAYAHHSVRGIVFAARTNKLYQKLRKCTVVYNFGGGPMRNVHVLACLMVLAFLGDRTVEAQEHGCFGRGDFAWHPPFKLFGEHVCLDEPDPDAQLHDQDMLAELTGDPEAILKFSVGRSLGIKNGFAVIMQGERYIVFDPAWYADASKVSRYLVLGHEIGHHVCGHTKGTRMSRWEVELEADRYAGAAIRRAGGALEQVLQAAARRYSTEGSRTHPPRADRLAAIRAGFNNGSPCKTRD